MGLLETLNPFHRGRVWAWLANSARYGHCVEERRYAKRWFLDGDPRTLPRGISFTRLAEPPPAAPGGPLAR